MSNETILRTFPDNECEALAMLYVQNQDLSGVSPEALLDMYQKAYDQIRVHYKDTRPERRSTGWSI